MEPKDRTYIPEILEEIKKVTITAPETNDKLQDVPKNIAPVENPGTEHLVSWRHNQG